MNKIIIIGRLTKDPELKYTQSGVAVANFTVAVNRRFKNAQGQSEADFIDVVVWKGAAESCANYLNKGNRVAVEGRLQIRTYEAQDGSKRKVAEIVAEAVDFLEPKKTGDMEDIPF